MLTSKDTIIALALRCIFFILGKLPFVLALIFVGFFAFYINDQGQDLMAAFATVHLWKSWYQLFFILFLFLWANTIWNVSRVLLSAANLTKVIQNPVKDARILTNNGQPAPANYLAVCIEERYARAIYNLYKWVPRVLIFTPYAIFIASWMKENNYYSMKPVGVTILAIVHFLIITYRLKIAGRASNDQNKTKNKSFDDIMDTLKEETSFIESLKKANVRIIALFTLLATVAVFIYASLSAFSPPIEKGKPGLVILSALIFYTVVTFVINLVSKNTKLPVFLIMIIFAVGFATCNNNHAVEMLHTPTDRAMLQARDALPDTNYFNNWLTDKINTGVYTNDTSKSDVIFIVAAEGGGIRDCYWTEVVLKKLQETNTSFYNKTFAVTGASGGSVGLGFYYSYLYQNGNAFRNSGFKNINLTQVGLDSICTADFLSRVTFGFMYPDLWQRFIPFKIKYWDRGKYLSQSFSGAYSASLSDKNQSILTQNYLKMWTGNDRYNYPVILFNSLYVEKGTKAIFSPYKLSQKYYTDALDILTVTKRAVPMRECMLSTARFPFVTPPGLLMYDSTQASVKNYVASKDIEFGHIMDGGAFDNKAIQTAQQTALMIKDQLKAKNLDKKFKVKIIYIGYGTKPLVPGNDPTTAPKTVSAFEKPLKRTYELAPLMGGTNTIFRWIYSAYGLNTHLDSSLNVINFGLRNKFPGVDHTLPLGWYLSPYSKRIIKNEVDSPHLKESYAEFTKQ